MAQPNAQMQLVLDHLAKFGAPALEALSPENARKLPTLKNAVEEIMSEHVLARAATLVKPNPPHVARIAHRMIPRPGGEVLARIYRPPGEAVLPILVYFHGGGWVIAGPDVYDASCRALCTRPSASWWSVAYRQAPEHKFPAAVDDAYCSGAVGHRACCRARWGSGARGRGWRERGRQSRHGFVPQGRARRRPPAGGAVADLSRPPTPACSRPHTVRTPLPSRSVRR